MKTWAERTREEAHLLNPAFCCSILSSSIRGYMSVKKAGIPFPITFLVLPIILHKPTREALPPNIRTSMATWLLENSVARVLFYERLMSLKPYTREAIQFGLLSDWLLLTDSGILETKRTESDITRAIQKLNDEVRVCMMRANFLGRWFAKAGTTHMIMAFWGVRS